jgi:hypothetical protein
MQHLERQTTSTYVATFGDAGSQISIFLDLWSTCGHIFHLLFASRFWPRPPTRYVYPFIPLRINIPQMFPHLKQTPPMYEVNIYGGRRPHFCTSQAAFSREHTAQCGTGTERAAAARGRHGRPAHSGTASSRQYYGQYSSVCSLCMYTTDYIVYTTQTIVYTRHPNTKKCQFPLLLSAGCARDPSLWDGRPGPLVAVYEAWHRGIAGPPLSSLRGVQRIRSLRGEDNAPTLSKLT